MTTRESPVNPEYHSYGINRDFGEGEMPNYIALYLDNRDLVQEQVSPVLRIYADQESYNDSIMTGAASYISDATYRPFFVGADPANKPHFVGHNQEAAISMGGPGQYVDCYDLRASLFHDAVAVPGFGGYSAFRFGLLVKNSGCIAEDVVLTPAPGYEEDAAASGIVCEGGITINNFAVRGTLVGCGTLASGLGINIIGFGDSMTTLNFITIASNVSFGVLQYEVTGSGRMQADLNNLVVTHADIAPYYGYPVGSAVYTFVENGVSFNAGIEFEEDGITPVAGDTIAIDQGVSIPGIDDDIYGHARPIGDAVDMGAVERQCAGEPPVPGRHYRWRNDDASRVVRGCVSRLLRDAGFLKKKYWI